MKNYVLFLSACLLLFSTACTVNKRAHRPGYNVEWHSANPQPKKHPKAEEQDAVKERQAEPAIEESMAMELESPVAEEEQAITLPEEENVLAGGERNVGVLEYVSRIGQHKNGISENLASDNEASSGAPQERNSRADNLAIWGFVVSLAGFWIPFAGPIAAIILSSIALNQMRDNPIEHRYKGLAIAGLAIGIAGLVFWGFWTLSMIYWWW